MFYVKMVIAKIFKLLYEVDLPVSRGRHSFLRGLRTYRLRMHVKGTLISELVSIKSGYLRLVRFKEEAVSGGLYWLVMTK